MLKKPNPRLKPDQPEKPEVIKVVVVGHEGSGKTQMLNSYCNQKFQEEHEQTIGSDFFNYTGKFGSGSQAKTVNIQFWDLAGDISYVEVRNEFYKEVQLCMIVTDTTKQESFDGIDMWLREVSKHGGEKLPVVIVGTKTDLKNKR